MKRITALSIFSFFFFISIPLWADEWGQFADNERQTAYSEKMPSEDVLTLAQGLSEVTSEGYQVLITQEEENMAAADVRLARSGFFPTIGGSADHTSMVSQIATVTQTAVPIVSSDGRIIGQGTQALIVPQYQTEFWSVNASVQQTLFDFWRTISRYKQSRELLSNRQIDTARVRNLSALQFTTAYFDLLEAEKMVGVAKQEVERLEGHRRDAQTLYNSGVITKNDWLQAEVRLKDGAQRLLSAENAKTLQVSRINNLLVRSLTTPLHALDIGYSLEAPPLSLEAAWEEALKERPEIKIAQGSLKVLQLEKTARQADYYPVIFVKGEVDYTQNEYVFHNTNWAATVGMNINLFSGGATSAAIARVKSQQAQVLKQLAKLKDDIRLEVQNICSILTTPGTESRSTRVQWNRPVKISGSTKSGMMPEKGLQRKCWMRSSY